jgi:MSHA biogenesis protein MshK
MLKNIILLLGVIAIGWSLSLSAATLRDPTKPEDLVIEGSKNSDELQLNAIIISPERQIAIINNQILHVGDQINNAKVISIIPNTVQLEGSSGKITLFLLNQSIKQIIKQQG